MAARLLTRFWNVVHKHWLFQKGLIFLKLEHQFPQKCVMNTLKKERSKTLNGRLMILKCHPWSLLREMALWDPLGRVNMIGSTAYCSDSADHVTKRPITALCQSAGTIRQVIREVGALSHRLTTDIPD